MKIKQSMNVNKNGIAGSIEPYDGMPLLLSPALKHYLWGGTRLADEFGKGAPGEHVAESWECSTHKNGRSVVRNGGYAGKTLQEVLALHPSLLGSRWQGICPPGELPVMVKLLEAKENASIQVHPGDEYARRHENGSHGKTEMWYVIDATENARLVYGFSHDMEPEQLRESIENGTIEKYLQKVPVHRDDVFFIPPGCVHSVGAGILVAEVQENSDVTYRLYDYDRKDANGERRELHIEKALEVLDMHAGDEVRQPMRVLHYEPGCATEFLCRCRYFQVERKLIHREDAAGGVVFETDETSFRILLCIRGEGMIRTQCDKGAVTQEIAPGDCLFVPAGCRPFAVSGNMTILQILC